MRWRWDRERYNRWLREWGPWTAAWLALAGWWMAPLWSAKILPLHDLPNHLAHITAYHYLPDARWNLQQFYERAMGPMPYVAHYFTVHLLAFLTRSVVRANLVFMTLYVLVTPLCGLALARVTGRSRWLALLLLPLGLGLFFHWGFIAFCFASMLTLPAVALLYQTLDEPTPRRAAALFAITCLLYLMHVLPWGAFGIYAILILIIEAASKRWRPALIAAGSLVPSALLFLWALHRAGSSGFMHSQEPYFAQNDSIPRLIQRAGTLLDLWQKSSVDEWVLTGAIVAVLALIFSDAGPGQGEPLRRRIRLPLAIVVFIALACATPFWIKRPFNWWMVNERFLMLLAAFGLFLPRGPIRGARAVLLAGAIAATAIIPKYLIKNWRDFSARAWPIVDLIQSTPLGSTTLLLHTPARTGINRDFTDPVLAPEMTIWRELYNYPLVYRGGFDPYLYDNGFPVRRIKLLSAPKVESALVHVYQAEETHFSPETMLTGWDYFIVRDDYMDAMPPDGVVLVRSEGRYSLFRNLLKDQPAQQ